MTLSEHENLALKFANALVKGEFEVAHSMLSSTLREKMSIEDLSCDYEEMIEYGTGPVTETIATLEMQDYPDRQNNDLGWAYISMSGEDFSEAVAVTVCEEDNSKKIRELEWGRP